MYKAPLLFKSLRNLRFSILTFLLTICSSMILNAQIAQRGSARTSTTSSSTSLTISKPSGVVAGDIMIANIATQGNNIAATSSGWTRITSAALGGSATKYGTLLYKIAGSAEASSYSFSLGTGTTGGAGAIIAFSGVDNTNPFDVATGTISTSTSTSVTASSITTVTPNTVVIMFGQAVGVTGGSSTSWSSSSWRTATSPGTLSEKYDAQQSTRRVSVGAAWALKSTAGSTGAGSATIASSVGNGGILIALRPRATDITRPTVSSTTPTSNATGVATGTNITAVFSESLTASTVNGTNVFLRAGTTSIPATVSYTAGSQNVILDPTSALTAGTIYTATLKGGTGGIQDAAGNNLAADYTWSFTTASAADVIAPVSSITSPSNGASFTVNQAITISGTASDEGGLNRVEVSVNGGSTWQAATGTNNWSFSWTPSTTGSYVIKSRGIDNTGNTEVAGTAPAANAINVTVIAADLIPPTVASTTPTSNATGVATGTNITAVFSESLTASTVNGTNVFLRAGTTSIPATVSYTAGSQNVILDPTSSLTAGTIYTATLKGGTGGIQDAAGNNLAADYTWSFTTASAADVIAPVSSISSPANGASFTVNQAITISGTASDAGGLNRVEVSVNGGSTWQTASGTNNWSYSWTPSSAGSYVIKSRGIDNTGNTEVAGTAPAANAINVTITAVVSDGCPCTIFTSSQSSTAIGFGI